MASKNENHPEKRPDEVFMGNATEEDFANNMSWETRRMGKTAYDANGNPISDPLYPVFVKKREVPHLVW